MYDLIVLFGRFYALRSGILLNFTKSQAPLSWSNVLDSKSPPLGLPHVLLLRTHLDNLSVVTFLRYFLLNDLTSLIQSPLIPVNHLPNTRLHMYKPFSPWAAVWGWGSRPS